MHFNIKIFLSSYITSTSKTLFVYFCIYKYLRYCCVLHNMLKIITYPDNIFFNYPYVTIK